MNIQKELEYRYSIVFKKALDLNNPMLFTEKMQYLKIHEPCALKSICADKLRVRHYFSDTIGYDLGIDLLGVLNDSNELDCISEFPVVAKCNHGSGMNMLLYSKSDIADAKDTFTRWLHTDYSRKCIEPWYSPIKPCIIVEPYIPSRKEFKIFVFNGNGRIIEVMDGNAYRYYDRNWNILNWLQRKKHRTTPGRLDARPSRLDEMCSLAETLAKPFKFVRVDFLVDTDADRLYCTEMTFAPGAGFCIYDGDGDRILGGMLDI